MSYVNPGALAACSHLTGAVKVYVASQSLCCRICTLLASTDPRACAAHNALSAPKRQLPQLDPDVKQHARGPDCTPEESRIEAGRKAARTRAQHTGEASATTHAEHAAPDVINL